MAQQGLTFDATFSIPNFLKQQGASKLQVVRNPNNGKLFFITDTGLQGAVSNSVDLDNDSVSISNCTTEEGESMWMLHKENKSNVEKEWSL